MLLTISATTDLFHGRSVRRGSKNLNQKKKKKKKKNSGQEKRKRTRKKKKKKKKKNPKAKTSLTHSKMPLNALITPAEGYESFKALLANVNN